MLQGVPANNPGNTAIAQGESTISGSTTGGLLNSQKDTKQGDASTAPQFGEVLQKIQSQYGAKAEKPREIKKTLGKDDFLKIMITQMRNQDPTSPFKAEQMATEMAQFTSVEQMQNINNNLQKMANQNQPLERLAMTNLIGKTVTVDRDRFPHTEGNTESLSYTLPKGAASVKLSIINEQGETVLEKDLGAQKEGEQAFGWDGLKVNTLPAKTGSYMFRIDATDERGSPIQTNPMKQTRVVGVSFEGAEPVFLIGDAKSQEKVTMKNIVKIDGDLPPPAAAPASAGAPAGQQGASAAPAKSFFTFEKGVGSKPLGVNPEDLIAKAQQALGQQASGDSKPAQGQAPDTRPQTPASQDKGFPSGLSDPEQQKSGIAQ